MATGEDLGRGPDWNDDGLPEIDVSIPDDIRELDREVQAYRREQRRARRQRLLRHLFPGAGRFGPYGVLAPVIAGALVVTALFGAVISLLGPRSALPPAASDSADTVSAVGEENVGKPLPDAQVAVDGADRQLSSLRSAVVVSVPAHCGCTTSIDTLTSTARTTGVAVYLSGEPAEMQKLAERSGRYPHVLDEAGSVLTERYHPAGLSAVLVDGEGKVADVVHDLQRGDPLPEQQLNRLGATPDS